MRFSLTSSVSKTFPTGTYEAHLGKPGAAFTQERVAVLSSAPGGVTWLVTTPSPHLQEAWGGP